MIGEWCASIIPGSMLRSVSVGFLEFASLDRHAMTSRYHPTYPSVRLPQEDRARPAPEFLRTAVMYQIFLRPFTPEGTLRAAQALLPHVASLGVDVVYLCPVAVADDDPRPEFWSARQQASGLGNARNPYRPKDYFGVDPEYGTAADLRDFVGAAHALGMRVLFDLVYFHCGPGAVFLAEHPEFVERDADGRMRLGDWRFPRLNLGNPQVREYLYGNMAHLLEEFGADGFRCDVGDCLPVDFWEEARRRAEAIRPDVAMLCEGLRGDDQHEAFDFSYGFYTQWAIRSMLKGERQATELRIATEQELRDYPRGFRWMRCFDNHDYALDSSMSGGRFEERFGKAACDAMLATVFLLNGVPMIYNGQEVADNMPHSIFSDRDHGRMLVNWSRALTAAGRERMALVRNLSALRHGNAELMDGPLQWLDTSCPEKVYAFRRGLAKDGLCLAVSLSDEPLRVAIGDAMCADPVLGAHGATGFGAGWELPAKGFVVWRE